MEHLSVVVRQEFEGDIREATLSGSDSIGRVAHVGARILRGIFPESEVEARELLQCGLMDELVERGLFPRTVVSDKNLPGFGLTLEHERIHPLILQTEWTFRMFRDAAVALLEVNRIAKKYGYETKDANLHNVTFVGTSPIFFDFGSFQRIRRPGHGWSAYNLFVRDVVWPLRLRAQGSEFTFRSLLDFGFIGPLANEDYIRLRVGALAGSVPVRMMALWKRLYAGVLSLGWCTEDEFEARITKSGWRRYLLAPFLRAIRDSRFAERCTGNFAALQKRVLGIRQPTPTTVWGGYQNSIFDDGGNLVSLPPRYRRILDLLSGLKLESVLEIAGNMGGLGLALYRNAIAEKVTCSDYDEEVVDWAYDLYRKYGGGSCSAAKLDVLQNSRSIKVPDVTERYRSDAVVALAVTHHLVLSQGIQGDLLMSRLAAFCHRFALIEFMPLGLWDNINRIQIEEPPSWYTRDWFRRHFAKYFEVITEEQVDENRIVFLGKKRSQIERT